MRCVDRSLSDRSTQKEEGGWRGRVSNPEDEIVEEGVSNRLIGPRVTLLCNVHAAARRPLLIQSQTLSVQCFRHHLSAPAVVFPTATLPECHMRPTPRSQFATPRHVIGTANRPRQSKRTTNRRKQSARRAEYVVCPCLASALSAISCLTVCFSECPSRIPGKQNLALSRTLYPSRPTRLTSEVYATHPAGPSLVLFCLLLKKIILAFANL